MRYAIVSDIHSNLEALLAVRTNIEGKEIDRIACLGDIVGYGADPVECIETVREMTSSIIMGNHDLAATGEMDTSFFNPVARIAVEWTHRQLSEEHIRFLRSLRYTMTFDDMMLVHATPTTPGNWDYLFTLYQVEQEFKFLEQRLCFVGHSHQPIIFLKNEKEIVGFYEETFKIPPESQLIVNVGSVGQPRDGDKRACYCIVDTDQDIVELVRVPYDIPKAQQKILTARLPEALAERLAWGH
jgi:diadenosine tetraphosphatase ApaH/serine/threonine PP2A family protein phosphatase